MTFDVAQDQDGREFNARDSTFDLLQIQSLSSNGNSE